MISHAKFLSFAISVGLVVAGTPQSLALSTQLHQSDQTPPARTDPQQHLANASALLETISIEDLRGDAEKRVSTLRKEFEQLMAAYQERQERPTGLSESGGVDWKTKFSDVERAFTSILGGAASRSSSAAVGTT